MPKGQPCLPALYVCNHEASPLLLLTGRAILEGIEIAVRRHRRIAVG